MEALVVLADGRAVVVRDWELWGLLLRWAMERRRATL